MEASGESGSANLRLDDITITAELDPGAIPSEFGWGSEGSAVALPDTSASLGVDLSWPGPDAIQGLQFDLTWDDAELAFLGLEPGSAVAPGDGWTLDAEPLAGSARIVLLGHEGAALDPGVYSGLMSIRFEARTFDSPDPQPTSSDVTISGAVFAAATPEGDDISIVGGIRTHTIMAQPSSPEISVAPDTLRFGAVAVGSSLSQSVTISNPASFGDLQVSDITSSTSEFTPSLTNGSVAAGSSLDVDIVFAPGATRFGLLEGTLTLTHDAGGDPVVVALEGIGTGGRGDADGDGAVDVADILVGIDIVLGVQAVTPDVLGRADLHPFPSGNGSIDVRDLTVQVQAVLANAWPDAVTLPTPAPIEEPPSAEKRAPVMVRVDQSGPDPRLVLDSSQSLRGVQLVLRDTGSSSHHSISAPLMADDPPAGSIAQSYRTPGSDISRIVIARPPGNMIGAGKTELIGWSLTSSAFELVYGVAVTEDGQKLVVVFDDAGSTTAEPSPQLPQTLDLALSVFPNPWNPSSHTELSLEVIAASRKATSIPAFRGGEMVTFELIDVSGRVRVTTRNRLGTGMRLGLKGQRLESGLYFARVRGAGIDETAPVVIVR